MASSNTPSVVSTPKSSLGAVGAVKEVLMDKSTSQLNIAPKITPTEVKSESNLEAHYNELLRMIGEIGRDVKPAYTNSKVSTDRLRRSIMISRGVLRECLGDLEKLAQSSSSSS